MLSVRLMLSGAKGEPGPRSVGSGVAESVFLVPEGGLGLHLTCKVGMLVEEQEGSGLTRLADLSGIIRPRGTLSLRGIMMERPLAAPAVELVDQHYRAVYGYAYRLSGSVIESEDLTQQTFMLAQANLAQLREPRAARVWLYTIARNEFLRRRPVATAVALDDAPEIASPVAESEWFDGELTSERLQEALDELPVEFRVPVVLFYFENLSYRDIAEQLDLPLGTIMSRLSRAKSQLRRTLERYLLEPQIRHSPGA